MPRTDTSGKRCSYAKCENPDGSNQFYVIDSSRTSGGQDWTPLDGQTICNACYCRYKRNGTLERAMNKPLPKDERRCSYVNCRKKDEGSHFYEIVEGQTAGGQDWSKLAGSVLCNACYLRYWKWGSLERYLGRKNNPGETNKQTPAVGPEGERMRRATRKIAKESFFIPVDPVGGVKRKNENDRDAISSSSVPASSGGTNAAVASSSPDSVEPQLGTVAVLSKRAKFTETKRVPLEKQKNVKNAVGKGDQVHQVDRILADAAKDALDMLCKVCAQVGEKK